MKQIPNRMEGYHWYSYIPRTRDDLLRDLTLLFIPDVNNIEEAKLRAQNSEVSGEGLYVSQFDFLG